MKEEYLQDSQILELVLPIDQWFTTIDSQLSEKQIEERLKTLMSRIGETGPKGIRAVFLKMLEIVVSEKSYFGTTDLELQRLLLEVIMIYLDKTIMRGITDKSDKNPWGNPLGDIEKKGQLIKRYIDFFKDAPILAGDAAEVKSINYSFEYIHESLKCLLLNEPVSEILRGPFTEFIDSIFGFNYNLLALYNLIDKISASLHSNWYYDTLILRAFCHPYWGNQASALTNQVHLLGVQHYIKNQCGPGKNPNWRIAYAAQMSLYHLVINSSNPFVQNNAFEGKYGIRYFVDAFCQKNSIYLTEKMGLGILEAVIGIANQHTHLASPCYTYYTQLCQACEPSSADNLRGYLDKHPLCPVPIERIYPPIISTAREPQVDEKDDGYDDAYGTHVDSKEEIESSLQAIEKHQQTFLEAQESKEKQSAAEEAIQQWCYEVEKLSPDIELYESDAFWDVFNDIDTYIRTRECSLEERWENFKNKINYFTIKKYNLLNSKIKQGKLERGQGHLIEIIESSISFKKFKFYPKFCNKILNQGMTLGELFIKEKSLKHAETCYSHLEVIAKQLCRDVQNNFYKNVGDTYCNEKLLGFAQGFYYLGLNHCINGREHDTKSEFQEYLQKIYTIQNYLEIQSCLPKYQEKFLLNEQISSNLNSISQFFKHIDKLRKSLLFLKVPQWQERIRDLDNAMSPSICYIIGSIEENIEIFREGQALIYIKYCDQLLPLLKCWHTYYNLGVLKKVLHCYETIVTVCNRNKYSSQTIEAMLQRVKKSKVIIEGLIDNLIKGKTKELFGKLQPKSIKYPLSEAYQDYQTVRQGLHTQLITTPCNLSKIKIAYQHHQETFNETFTLCAHYTLENLDLGAYPNFTLLLIPDLENPSLLPAQTLRFAILTDTQIDLTFWRGFIRCLALAIHTTTGHRIDYERLDYQHDLDQRYVGNPEELAQLAVNLTNGAHPTEGLALANATECYRYAKVTKITEPLKGADIQITLAQRYLNELIKLQNVDTDSSSKQTLLQSFMPTCLSVDEPAAIVLNPEENPLAPKHQTSWGQALIAESRKNLAELTAKIDNHEMLSLETDYLLPLIQWYKGLGAIAGLNERNPLTICQKLIEQSHANSRYFDAMFLSQAQQALVELTCIHTKARSDTPIQFNPASVQFSELETIKQTILEPILQVEPSIRAEDSVLILSWVALTDAPHLIPKVLTLMKDLEMWLISQENSQSQALSDQASQLAAIDKKEPDLQLRQFQQDQQKYNNISQCLAHLQALIHENLTLIDYDTKQKASAAIQDTLDQHAKNAISSLLTEIIQAVQGDNYQPHLQWLKSYYQCLPGPSSLQGTKLNLRAYFIHCLQIQPHLSQIDQYQQTCLEKVIPELLHEPTPDGSRHITSLTNERNPEWRWQQILRNFLIQPQEQPITEDEKINDEEPTWLKKINQIRQQTLEKYPNTTYLAWYDPNQAVIVHGLLQPDIQQQLIAPKSFAQQQGQPDPKHPQRCTHGQQLVLKIKGPNSQTAIAEPPEERSDLIILAYAKIPPKYPSVQVQASNLQRRLGARALHSTLCHCTPSQWQPYAIQFSEPIHYTMSDQSEVSVLVQKQHAIKPKPADITIQEVESALSPCDFTLGYLAHQLIRDEDGKFTNVGIEKIINDQGEIQYRFVDIDQDQAFVSAIDEEEAQKSGKLIAKSKHIAYCASLMQKPMNSKAVATFLKLDPWQLTAAWLADQANYQKVYCGLKKADKSFQAGLFSSKTLAELFKTKGCFLPFLLDHTHDGADIALRMQTMQAELRKYQPGSYPSPLTFMQKIEPNLGKLHQQVFSPEEPISSNIVTRFDKLKKNYLLIRNDAYQTCDIVLISRLNLNLPDEYRHLVSEQHAIVLIKAKDSYQLYFKNTLDDINSSPIENGKLYNCLIKNSNLFAIEDNLVEQENYSDLTETIQEHIIQQAGYTRYKLPLERYVSTLDQTKRITQSTYFHQIEIKQPTLSRYWLQLKSKPDQITEYLEKGYLPDPNEARAWVLNIANIYQNRFEKLEKLKQGELMEFSVWPLELQRQLINMLNFNELAKHNQVRLLQSVLHRQHGYHSFTGLLDLSYCQALDNKSLKTLLENHPQITGLKLSDCSFINHKTIAIFTRYGPNIQTLNLSGCHLEGLNWIKLAQFCLELVHLDLSDTKFTPPFKGSWPSLKTLILDRSKVETISINAPHLSHLSAQDCPYLRLVITKSKVLHTLDFWGCICLTPTVLAARLMSNEHIQQLRTIYLPDTSEWQILKTYVHKYPEFAWCWLAIPRIDWNKLAKSLNKLCDGWSVPVLGSHAIQETVKNHIEQNTLLQTRNRLIFNTVTENVRGIYITLDLFLDNYNDQREQACNLLTQLYHYCFDETLLNDIVLTLLEFSMDEWCYKQAYKGLGIASLHCSEETLFKKLLRTLCNRTVKGGVGDHILKSCEKMHTSTLLGDLAKYCTDKTLVEEIATVLCNIKSKRDYFSKMFDFYPEKYACLALAKVAPYCSKKSLAKIVKTLCNCLRQGEEVSDAVKPIIQVLVSSSNEALIEPIITTLSDCCTSSYEHYQEKIHPYPISYRQVDSWRTLAEIAFDYPKQYFSDLIIPTILAQCKNNKPIIYEILIKLVLGCHDQTLLEGIIRHANFSVSEEKNLVALAIDALGQLGGCSTEDLSKYIIVALKSYLDKKLRESNRISVCHASVKIAPRISDQGLIKDILSDLCHCFTNKLKYEINLTTSGTDYKVLLERIIPLFLNCWRIETTLQVKLAACKALARSIPHCSNKSLLEDIIRTILEFYEKYTYYTYFETYKISGYPEEMLFNVVKDCHDSTILAEAINILLAYAATRDKQESYDSVLRKVCQNLGDIALHALCLEQTLLENVVSMLSSCLESKDNEVFEESYQALCRLIPYISDNNLIREIVTRACEYIGRATYGKDGKCILLGQMASHISDEILIEEIIPALLKYGRSGFRNYAAAFNGLLPINHITIEILHQRLVQIARQEQQDEKFELESIEASQSCSQTNSQPTITYHWCKQDVSILDESAVILSQQSGAVKKPPAIDSEAPLPETSPLAPSTTNLGIQSPDEGDPHEKQSSDLKSQGGTDKPLSSDVPDEKNSKLEYTSKNVKPVCYNEAMILKMWTRFAEHDDRKICYFLERDEKASTGEEDRIVLQLFNKNMSPKQEAALLLNENHTLYQTKTIAGQDTSAVQYTSISLCSMINYASMGEGRADENVANLREALNQFNTWKTHHGCFDLHTVLFAYHANENHWCLGLLELNFDRETAKIKQQGFVSIYDPLDFLGDKRIGRPSDVINNKVQRSISRTIEITFKLEVSTFCLSYHKPKLGPDSRPYRRQQPFGNGNACGVIVAENGKDIIAGYVNRLLHDKYTEAEINMVRLQHLNEAQDRRFSQLQREDQHRSDKNIKGDSPKAPFNEVYQIFEQVLLAHPAREFFVSTLNLFKQATQDCKSTDEKLCTEATSRAYAHLRYLKHLIIVHKEDFTINLPVTKRSLFSVFFTKKYNYEDGGRDLLDQLADIGFSSLSPNKTKPQSQLQQLSNQLRQYYKSSALLDDILLQPQKGCLHLASYSDYSLWRFKAVLLDEILSYYNSLGQYIEADNERVLANYKSKVCAVIKPLKDDVEEKQVELRGGAYTYQVSLKVLKWLNEVLFNHTNEKTTLKKSQERQRSQSVTQLTFWNVSASESKVLIKGSSIESSIRMRSSSLS